MACHCRMLQKTRATAAVPKCRNMQHIVAVFAPTAKKNRCNSTDFL